MASIDGIYATYMSGMEGEGFAIFVLSGGQITGADPEGVTFDGSYHLNAAGDALEGRLEVKVPANGVLVQGVQSGPSGMEYSVALSLPLDFAAREFVRVETALGPVNVRFKTLRLTNAS